MDPELGSLVIDMPTSSAYSAAVETVERSLVANYNVTHHHL